MTKRKTLGLDEQINRIDNNIEELKKLIEKKIIPEIEVNTKDLQFHIHRTNTLENHVFATNKQFEQSNNLMITQTELLAESLEKIRSEIKQQTDKNQDLIKKSAPFIAFLTVLATIILELVKNFFK